MSDVESRYAAKIAARQAGAGQVQSPADGAGFAEAKRALGELTKLLEERDGEIRRLREENAALEELLKPDPAPKEQKGSGGNRR